MGFIGRFLGIPPEDPPTDRQVSYARDLGIQKPERFSKAELSNEIDRVKASGRPTVRQIQLAEKLGVKNAARLSGTTISKAIDQAKQSEQERLARDPAHQKKQAKKRERKDNQLAKRDAERLAEFGQEKLAEEMRWQALCDDPKNDYALVVFEQRKNRKVEVVCFESASLEEKGKVRLDCSGPKKFREDGDIYFEWKKEMHIFAHEILHHEFLSEDLTGCGQAEYDAVISRGTKISKNLG